MMQMVGAEELRAALPMARAIDALEAAFAEEDPSAAAPLRSTLETPFGTLLLMPASGDRGVGIKLVTLTPTNPPTGRPFVQAAYILFDAITQAPRAALDGGALTSLRTAAVSGLATRHLARPDATRLVVVGAGVQAATHVEAMLAVRPIDDVVIVSRTAERARGLADRARASGVRVAVGDLGAVSHADIVCTCTTSRTPVVQGTALAPGTHLNAVGAFEPDTREIDTDAVLRSRVVVETREVADGEAGDLLMPLAEGAIDRGHVVADLRELVTGARVRRDRNDITLFVSVGMAFEDLVVARAVLESLA